MLSAREDYSVAYKEIEAENKEQYYSLQNFRYRSCQSELVLYSAAAFFQYGKEQRNKHRNNRIEPRQPCDDDSGKAYAAGNAAAKLM